VLRGCDVDEVVELKPQGLSIRAISRLIGYDRKTIRRYLASPRGRPAYELRPPNISDSEKLPRPAAPSSGPLSRCKEP